VQQGNFHYEQEEAFHIQGVGGFLEPYPANLRPHSGDKVRGLFVPAQA
jgi:hypothetical protein